MTLRLYACNESPDVRKSTGLYRLWALTLHVQATAGNAQHPRQPAFVDRTAASTQRARQLHFVRLARYCPPCRALLRLVGSR
jgi:hypothetical protein